MKINDGNLGKLEKEYAGYLEGDKVTAKLHIDGMAEIGPDYIGPPFRKCLKAKT